MKADSLKGHLDTLILSVVEPAPLHGYAIIAELKRRSGGELALPEGTVYPALHRLEGAGLLQSAWSDAEGRRRRVYTLSGRGRRKLGTGRSDWRRFAAVVDSVLAPIDPAVLT
jgi:PadR family transcriptional regulator, regulatory protein PadR